MAADFIDVSLIFDPETCTADAELGEDGDLLLDEAFPALTAPSSTTICLCWSAAMDHDRIRQAQALRVKALKCRRWAITACDDETAARLTAMASAYEGQADALEQDVAAPCQWQQGR
ncbi:hypothetical protein QO058_23665 [Bosea vestrisii]|uniref:hypothetical protein n=1 Tax=Bosea vestrisii TaxID=151416 RepID=UPI0024DF9E9D|nr:hypothetical protein [Bosea vestrisii]WID95721.1 hypothetical protein QO058_23665 [Bosea vestrisii]